MQVYEGHEPYIFVSYSHKDASQVLPCLEALCANGYRVWYDSGIEAGTEWPAYIEDHLNRCARVVVFMSESAVESVNCRNEINYALAAHKEMLVVYLEETKLRYGMGLQLGSSQSLFYYRHPSDESFLKELCAAKILAVCKGQKTAPIPAATMSHAPAIKPVSDSAPCDECVQDDEVKELIKKAQAGDREAQRELGFRYTAGKGVEQSTKKAIEWFRKASQSQKDCAGQETDSGAQEVMIAPGIFVCNRTMTVNSMSSLPATRYDRDPKWNEIETLIVGEGVEKIELEAFMRMDNLREVVLPSTLTGIAIRAFYECRKLERVVIPEGVTRIGKEAFEKCYNLSHITLPRSLKYIGDSAFGGCRFPQITVSKDCVVCGGNYFNIKKSAF